jgi:hypothetical protein
MARRFAELETLAFHESAGIIQRFVVDSYIYFAFLISAVLEMAQRKFHLTSEGS